MRCLSYLSPKSSLRVFVVPLLRRAAFLFVPEVDLFRSRIYSVFFVFDAMVAPNWSIFQQEGLGYQNGTPKSTE